MGGGLFLVVLLAVVLGMNSGTPYGFSLIELAALYILGGTGGGAVLGILRPLNRTFLGEICIGCVALMPLSLMIAWGMKDSAPEAPPFWEGGLVVSIVLGAVYAAVFRTVRRYFAGGG